jgi:hypothetical protein
MLQPTVENYIHQLKDVIDQGYFALVYFDVVLGINNPRLGFPDMQGSKYEHSAVLFGYMTTESNRDYFYAYQWDKYFTMNATNLLASTINYSVVMVKYFMILEQVIWRIGLS